jgi:hypothetical protein
MQLPSVLQLQLVCCVPDQKHAQELHLLLEVLGCEGCLLAAAAATAATLAAAAVPAAASAIAAGSLGLQRCSASLLPAWKQG